MGFLSTAGSLGFFSLSLKFARNDSGFFLTSTTTSEKDGAQTASSNDYDRRCLTDSIMRGHD